MHSIASFILRQETKKIRDGTSEWFFKSKSHPANLFMKRPLEFFSRELDHQQVNLIFQRHYLQRDSCWVSVSSAKFFECCFQLGAGFSRHAIHDLERARIVFTFSSSFVHRGSTKVSSRPCHANNTVLSSSNDGRVTVCVLAGAAIPIGIRMQQLLAVAALTLISFIIQAIYAQLIFSD